MDILILLSGPTAVGKSAVADGLVSQSSFSRVSTSSYLKDLAAARGQEISKASLQNIGDELDRATDFEWVASRAELAFRKHPNTTRWLLDSVRKERQVEIFRQKFGSAIQHIHLTAPEEILRQRYEARRIGNNEVGVTPYSEMSQHSNEVSSRSLIHFADVVFDTSTVSTAEIIARILSTLEDRRV